MNKIHWIKLITFRYSLSEIIDYFRANFRYWCYYHDDLDINNLLPLHIKEQIDFRIDVMMDKECFNNGQCKVCGCTTTQLQMTNKSCEGHCYPCIVNKTTWEFFKNNGIIISNGLLWRNHKTVIKFYPSNKQDISKQEYNEIE